MSDCEVDDTTNQLLIVCWLTLCGARVGIQFEVSVERGCHKFALSHPERVHQVEDVVSLGDHNAGWSSNYLDSKEVMELLHVCHLDLLERGDLTLLMSTRCSPPMTRSSTYRMMTIGLESLLT